MGRRAKEDVGGLWVCGKCKQLLPAESYYADARTKNGLMSRCRACHYEACHGPKQNLSERKPMKKCSVCGCTAKDRKVMLVATDGLGGGVLLCGRCLDGRYGMKERDTPVRVAEAAEYGVPAVDAVGE
jgi:hypothetical protein